MVTLEHIQTLEGRVLKAVAYITQLKDENSLLQKSLDKYRKRIDELEVLINEYTEDQNAIEEGIKNALLHLDKLEDSKAKAPAAKAPAAAAPVPEIEDIEGEEVELSMEVDAGPPPAAAKAQKTEKKEDELDIF